jgi:hypothetical protein
VVSLAFLVVTPITLGGLIALSGHYLRRSDWRYYFAGPALVCGLWGAVTALLSFEPLLCVVMAMPLAVVMAVLGGTIAKLVLSRRKRPFPLPVLTSTSLLVAFVPFGAGYVEGGIDAPTNQRNVHTQIDIKSENSVIWDHITHVYEIKPEEQRFSWFHALGLPKPREAVITYDGVGATRDASFGLSFVERVTDWQYRRLMAFSITVDDSKARPGVLQAIGRHYFEVLRGTYRIEVLRDGTCRLHLNSVERLSTHLNWYAGFWTDSIMRHLQNYILQIIRNRCQRAVPSKELIARRDLQL